MAHGETREGKWRGNWRMEWVASTLHTTSEHGVSSITTADAHTSAASSRLKWHPCWFKWTSPFRRKTKYVFCACAITFQRSLRHFVVRFYKNSIKISVTAEPQMLPTNNTCSIRTDVSRGFIVPNTAGTIYCAEHSRNNFRTLHLLTLPYASTAVHSVWKLSCWLRDTRK